MLRPRRPSGDDCKEMVEGLEVDGVPLGVSKVAGVTVNGTKVLINCLFVVFVEIIDGEGDDQHPLPFILAGEDVAEGVMMEEPGNQFTGSLRFRGAGASCVSSVSSRYLGELLVARESKR